jgi:OFA family oxalate/formate antiporter-like MFS transporter
MPRLANRWAQVVLGIICMFMIANFQFGWTAFVEPMIKTTGWKLSAIQWAFTIFVLVETWLVPFEAMFVDRFGPKVMVIGGGILVALGWVVDGSSHALLGLYVGAVLSGIGAGMIYATCVPNAVKWFARHRGLAVGLTVAGFGAGAALTVTPLYYMIDRVGPFPTFTFFGIVQGAVIVACGFFFVRPPAAVSIEEQRQVRVLQGLGDVPPQRTLTSPVFWLMYVAFTLVGAGGLMGVAQIGPIATSFHIAKAPIHLAMWVVPTLLLTLQLNNVVGGIARPLLGWVSDYVGREKTLAVAFTVEGVGVWAFSRYGHTPLTFVLLSALVFFAWGEIYSIFPSLVRDHFGQKYAATNYGMLYTAKGVASFLVPISSMITAATGSWTAALYLSAALNIVAALCVAALWPLRKHEILRGLVHRPDPITAASQVLAS